MLKPVLAGAMAALLASGIAAAETPQPPQPQPKGLSATGGTGTRGATPPVLGLEANEVRAADLRGKRILDAQGKEVGRIDDVLLDTRHRIVDLVGVKPDAASGNDVVVVPFAQLKPADKPDGGYVTSLTPEALAKGPSFEKTAQSKPDYVAVVHDLVGRPVDSQQQKKKVGTVVDLVMRRDSGAVDYLLVDEGAGLGIGNAAQAVAWNEVAQVPPKKGQPVVVKLDQQQLAQAPFFGLKAQQRPQQPNAERLFQQVPQSGSTLHEGTVVK